MDHPSDLRVRVEDGPDVLMSDIRVVLGSLMKWDATDLQITPVGGGITNLLYKVSAPSLPDSPLILLRIFGTNTEVIIDRDADTSVTQGLSVLGFGPKLYGVFANGRLEGFLDGAVPLSPSEMGDKDYATMIAGQVAHMHRLPMPGSRQPLLWDKIELFFSHAQAAAIPGIEHAPGGNAGKIPCVDFLGARRDLEWLRGLIDSTLAPSLTCTQEADEMVLARTKARGLVGCLVFAHNDLLSGNILRVPLGLSETTTSMATYRLQLIDYEYAGFNFAGYDIANHFCEYAGFATSAEDLVASYPSASARKHFFRVYVAALGERVPCASMAGIPVEDEVSQAFYEEFDRVVNIFALASHLFW